METKDVSITNKVAAVVIGRNEGYRLLACLQSLQDAGLKRVVYVDSGSTDGSVAAAEARGVEVVALDMTQPFTAARGRNAGLDHLAATGGAPTFIQFIDGDCELSAGWVNAAQAFLEAHPKVAVAAGRLREKFPDRSIYNRLCDDEWAEIPLGEIRACGGIMMVRSQALAEAGPFNASLIAGEESELCIRIRRKGWKIWRVDAEMALHDAAMTHFGQFWKRARRSGFALAEGAALYGRAPERHRVSGVRRALLWGAVIPVAILIAVISFGFAALWLLLVYPLQVTRTALRAGGTRIAWERSFFLVFGKFAEARGIFEYWWRRRLQGPPQLIEYK